MIIEANRHWQYTDTESNLIMPWYTLPVLQWLKTQSTKDWSVFEYGAGYSTIWWRLNCKELESIDHNSEWAKAVGAKFIQSKKAYIEQPIGPYDCIIIDGVHREECVEYCLPFIKNGGYLIIDNYGSEDYDIARTQELLEEWTCVIHKQPNHATWETAIFIKP